MFQKGTDKGSLVMFYHLCPRKRVTRIGLISLDKLANDFVTVLFIVKFRLYEHVMCFRRIVMADLGESMWNLPPQQPKTLYLHYNNAYG